MTYPEVTPEPARKGTLTELRKRGTPAASIAASNLQVVSPIGELPPPVTIVFAKNTSEVSFHNLGVFPELAELLDDLPEEISVFSEEFAAAKTIEELLSLFGSENFHVARLSVH